MVSFELDSMTNFKRFIKQTCIGYNEDYSKIFLECIVELIDGTRQTIYLTCDTIINNKLSESDPIYFNVTPYNREKHNVLSTTYN